MQYATGELGNKVYVRFNKRVNDTFDATSEGVQLQLMLAMPNYNLSIRDDNDIYYNLESPTSTFDAGSVIEIPKFGSVKLNVANPIIWTE